MAQRRLRPHRMAAQSQGHTQQSSKLVVVAQDLIGGSSYRQTVFIALKDITSRRVQLAGSFLALFSDITPVIMTK